MTIEKKIYIYNYLENKYNKPVVINYKQIVKFKLKQTKEKHDLYFLETCYNCHPYPNFLILKYLLFLFNTPINLFYFPLFQFITHSYLLIIHFYYFFTHFFL